LAAAETRAERASKVTSSPPPPTAVQRVGDAQASARSAASAVPSWTRRAACGAAGSKATSPPDSSIAAHRLTSEQDTAISARPPSIWPLRAAVGAAGSNVTSSPPAPTAVHRRADGQTTSASDGWGLRSTVTGAVWAARPSAPGASASASASAAAPSRQDPRHLPPAMFTTPRKPVRRGVP
jgi:hypothetical protein